MTNEVAPAGVPALPAFLQAHVTQNSGRPSADLASLSTAQNSTPRLSLRGKIFRFMEGQDEVLKSRDPVNVFIVGVEPGPGLFTKTFYAKAYSGADSAGEPPDCSSADGVRPDPWLQQPIHHECKSCPKNQFGSATSRKGRPSKACHDSKRLYISRTDAAVAEQPLNERTLYLSQVPVSSLRSLADYGKSIQEMGVEPWMVQTQLSMDEDSEFPELAFKVNGFIEEKQVEPMKARVAKREWATSRNLMLQNAPQRQALPPHLQNALGGGAGAQPVTNNLGAPAAVAPASTVTVNVTEQPAAAGGAVPGNTDVLKAW
jgi:hypothetical protein